MSWKYRLKAFIEWAQLWGYALITALIIVVGYSGLIIVLSPLIGLYYIYTLIKEHFKNGE